MTNTFYVSRESVSTDQMYAMALTTATTSRMNNIAVSHYWPFLSLMYVTSWMSVTSVITLKH